MDSKIAIELERLTGNAAMRREELLISGLRKSQRRKALNIGAGVLALMSAGAIATVITHLLGEQSMQIVAAFTAGLSGAISLIVTAYYNDGEILNMLNGASKYLALRESVYRLLIQPGLSDTERYNLFVELQNEYAKLDETYARYFSLSDEAGSSSRTQVGGWVSETYLDEPQTTLVDIPPKDNLGQTNKSQV